MSDGHKPRSITGRGAAANPKNRFEKLEVESDPAEIVDEPRPETVYLRDHSRSIVATNNSPDIGFDASINPYRGCSHGCAYCYSRPTHEYLGLSAGLDFESKVLVKEDAPGLLRERLASPRWAPKVLSMSGVTDPYQPVERKLGITRGCLQVLAGFRNPVVIVTKNHLVTRDVDLLSELARYGAAAVAVSLTTLDDDLRRVMEPRTSRPVRRLAAIRKLSEAGIPVGVMTAPVTRASTTTSCRTSSRPPRRPGPPSPATSRCAFPGPSPRSSRTGSNATSPTARGRCWATSAPCGGGS